MITSLREIVALNLLNVVNCTLPILTGDFMTELKINSEFCFDSSKKLTIEISYKALKNYSDKFPEALKLQKSLPIILDTNVLLAYYGMSQIEKKGLIEFLNENKNRIFLTSQIEKEFLNNRIKVINKDFFMPLENIQSEFQATYKDIKNKFKSFLESKKNILSKDYPSIWNSLLEKQEKLNEIFGDEQILSESIAEAIETTTMDYKQIYLMDKLLEVCANLKITSALSDEEVKFVKNQYDVLRKKYEAVKKPEIKRELTFPGCGDKSGKEDPYGDFIIFHEILKFMVCEKNGLDKTDVIFLTREKVKGDWFYQDLAPITHYIEKVFLVTEKTLFIIHADRPLGISFENIHQSNQQESPLEIWSENKLYKVEGNTLFSEIYMGHYRGWTILVSLRSTSPSWVALALNTLCYSYANFSTEWDYGDNEALPVLSKSSTTKEEMYISIKQSIDQILELNNKEKSYFSA